MVNIKNVIGWILGIVAVLMVIGQAQLINPVLDFGFDISAFKITVQAVVMIIAAYYLIKK